MEGSSYFADSLLTANRCAQLARKKNRASSTKRAPGNVFSDPPACEHTAEVEEIELPELFFPLPPPLAVANAKRQAAPTHASSEDDPGENRLIQDYGPAGTHDGDKKEAAPALWAASDRYFEDPPIALDRYITDEQGLRHRIVYDPTEMARLLQPHRRQSAGARWRLAGLLETALDPGRPGCESLLILKALTDAYLVTSRALDAAANAVDTGEDFLRTLAQAWQHSVRNRDRHADHRHTSVDLHVTASWFQAWAASYEVHDVLPGDWTWVLDHLESTGTPDG